MPEPDVPVVVDLRAPGGMLCEQSRFGVLDLPPPLVAACLRGGRKAVSMVETPELPTPTSMQAVSNAMVRLHKEQFGRGPTHARSDFAGPDTLVCTLENTLLPAERTMVEMGEQQRIRESRMFLQVASQDRFVEVVEQLVARKVRAFASAIDPDQGVVFEVFSFEPDKARGDGAAPCLTRRRP